MAIDALIDYTDLSHIMAIDALIEHTDLSHNMAVDALIEYNSLIYNSLIMSGLSVSWCFEPSHPRKFISGLT